ncbi:hypothetical protein AB6A40_000245 [Gnathostoma spinigerum]|uniref:Exocyst complex component Sec6 n=1 Tax=Gnathostoma spinigerum TaxID=75299 RepID=A0ABD6E2Y6_9BILA
MDAFEETWKTMNVEENVYNFVAHYEMCRSSVETLIHSYVMASENGLKKLEDLSERIKYTSSDFFDEIDGILERLEQQENPTYIDSGIEDILQRLVIHFDSNEKPSTHFRMAVDRYVQMERRNLLEYSSRLITAKGTLSDIESILPRQIEELRQSVIFTIANKNKNDFEKRRRKKLQTVLNAIVDEH